jgi:hypothetical protein
MAGRNITYKGKDTYLLFCVVFSKLSLLVVLLLLVLFSFFFACCCCGAVAVESYKLGLCYREYYHDFQRVNSTAV